MQYAQSPLRNLPTCAQLPVRKQGCTLLLLRLRYQVLASDGQQHGPPARRCVAHSVRTVMSPLERQAEDAAAGAGSSISHPLKSIGAAHSTCARMLSKSPQLCGYRK